MMLSSSDLSTELQRCRELGVQAYLTKPVTRTDLLRAICTIASPRNGMMDTPADGNTAHTHPQRQSLHVLVAEDNLVNQKLVCRLLEKRGYTPRVVASGVAALKALEVDAFDLLLLDLQMPEMDGCEVASSIRQRENGGERLPILALTAAAMKGDRERCLAAGMDGYVSKPIRSNELYEAIDQLMGADRAPRCSIADK
jgi:CheY-like chemotaxis protein